MAAVSPGRSHLHAVCHIPVVRFFLSGKHLRRTESDLEDKEGFGLSLGYRFTPAIGLEAHFARTETQDDFTGATTDFRSDRLSLDGYYTFNADGKFSPYVLIGAGQGRLKPDGLDSNVDTIVNAGLGAFYRFNDKVALRAEAREVFNSDEDLNDAVAMLGLRVLTGHPLLPSPMSPSRNLSRNRLRWKNKLPPR
jgi:opacity protein-like surface antigen